MTETSETMPGGAATGKITPSGKATRGPFRSACARNGDLATARSTRGQPTLLREGLFPSAVQAESPLLTDTSSGRQDASFGELDALHLSAEPDQSRATLNAAASGSRWLR